GLAAGARRGRSQGLRRPGWERDVPFGAFGRATAEGTGDARAILRAHRDRPGEPATTHRAGAQADRPRRRRASDRTPARPQLTRRRVLRDPSRRRPNLAGWPATRMVEARRMGRLVASQRRLLRAAHQSARLELRGAVADLYPAFRSGSGLSHP